MNIYLLYTVLTCGIAISFCKKYDRRDGKLLLKPVELVDLIAEEKLKTGTSSNHHTRQMVTEQTMQLLDLDEDDTTTEQESKDEESLRNRKVWSRWSKWGECSVTCGAGAISRRRACVSGRCARGEREEQRRPCVRAPCVDAHPDDQRDAD